jgi:ABC-type phosphate/phosphonate transport system substrate-binding protein
MKRILPALLIALTAFAACANAAPQKGKKYIFGFATSLSPSQNAQLKTSFIDILKVLSARENIEFQSAYYKGNDQLENAIKKGDVDFFLTDRYSTLLRAYKNYGFIPLMSFSMYGQKTPRYCMYAKSNGGYKTIPDLKGKKIAIGDGEEDYYTLRKLAGSRPENFFDLKLVTEGTAGLYAISVKEEDGIFFSEYGYDYVVMTNPALVKSIKPVFCGDPFYMVPLAYKKNTPQNVIDAIGRMLDNPKKDPELKKYAPLIKMVKLEYFPVTLKDLLPSFELIELAYKNGWNREFEGWLKQNEKDAK